MKQHRVARPLLWFYNPQLAGLYSALPAAFRVFHATENFFHLEHVSSFFLRQTRYALEISDLVVAVSPGVASSISREIPSANVHLVTNGCDFEFYAKRQSDQSAHLPLPSGFDRVAVYAGNINHRVDFDLLRSCVAKYPRILFALYGPVGDVLGRDRRIWRLLITQPNVRHFGPVDPDALPGLYRAADVGLIPYKNDRWLVENGFPLKALEMCATGLPVVSTNMKPIANLASALVVCETKDRFLDAVEACSRASLSTAERDELYDLSRKNDYDKKFEEVLGMIEPPRDEVCVDKLHMDRLLLAFAERTDSGMHGLNVRTRLASGVLAVSGKMPERLRAWMPLRYRRYLKNWLGL